MGAKNGKTRRQVRIPGGRIPRGAGFERAIDDAVEQVCKRENVSRPLLISVAVAKFLKMKIEDWI